MLLAPMGARNVATQHHLHKIEAKAEAVRVQLRILHLERRTLFQIS
jgi:hypothetical protein